MFLSVHLLEALQLAGLVENFVHRWVGPDGLRRTAQIGRSDVLQLVQVLTWEVDFGFCLKEFLRKWFNFY